MKSMQNSESRKHQHAVELLSRETQTSIERVSELYYIEHAKLERVARVKVFVPIFTSRKVRDALLNDRSDGDWNIDVASE
jgi:hypothetical protein